MISHQVYTGLILLLCIPSDWVITEADISVDTSMASYLYEEVVAKVLANSSTVMNVVPLQECNGNYTVEGYADLIGQIYHNEFSLVKDCKQTVNLNSMPKYPPLMMYVCIEVGLHFPGVCLAHILIDAGANSNISKKAVCASKPGVIVEVTSSTIVISTVRRLAATWAYTSDLFVYFFIYKEKEDIEVNNRTWQTETVSDQWKCREDERNTHPPAFPSCYRMFHFALPGDSQDNSAGAYNVASEACALHNGHIVHIESQAENDFIWNDVIGNFTDAHSTYAYYIGSRRNRQGQWIWWSSGVTLSYNNWDASAQANNGTCSIIKMSGYWMHALCSSAVNDVHGFVCEREDKDQKSLVPIIVIPFVLMLITSAVAVWWIRRCRKRKQMDSIKAVPERLKLGQTLLNNLIRELQMKVQPLLLNAEQLDVQDELGRGAFGSVFRGTMQHREADTVTVQRVAIKTITDNRIESDITAFVNEAILMAELKHPHILSIIGVCIDSKKEIPMIILPYMANSDLRTYLRKLRRDDKGAQPPDVRQLLLFCLHIYLGMAYLSNQKIIHRDLAARNCMVDADLVVKVADFGLARDVYSDSYYRQDQQKMLPVRWMGLECLRDHMFTIQSDVWSFGVTMWEVFSMGIVPYMHLDNADICSHLQAGNRLEQPDLCPPEMYILMMRCFENSPAERPGFTDVVEVISNYVALLSNYVDLNSGTIGNQYDYVNQHPDDFVIQQTDEHVIQHTAEIMIHLTDNRVVQETGSCATHQTNDTVIQ